MAIFKSLLFLKVKVIISTTANNLWNNNESNWPIRTVELVHINSDMTATTMKLGGFVISAGLSVLLNHTADVRQSESIVSVGSYLLTICDNKYSR